MSLLLIIAAALPLVAAPLVGLRTRLRPAVLALAPWTPLPALLLAIVPAAFPTITLPWLLLGTRVGLDTTGQVFLLFTALLWMLSGFYGRVYLANDPARERFWTFYLLALSGNLGLIIAQDLVTFYLCFVLMTFAAYPLVVHAGTAAANRAGRVYIVMAVASETMLLVAFMLAARSSASLALHDVALAVASSPQRSLIVGLLLAGFGVKAGALPLHVWLPLAHPVAPTPASAVLSGCMIKAGLLGWIRFLPLGLAALPGWGALVIGMGLTAAFFGVLIGATQRDAKTALAYSSISQMGIINVAVGIGLTRPDHWPSALAACLTYVVHHGLAKGALFLGVGVAAAAGTASVVARRLVAGGLLFAALAVAGAPLTSGSVAKGYLKDVALHSPAAWPRALEWLLPFAAMGTTLLMARFLKLALPRAGAEVQPRLTRGLWLPWLLLLVGVAMAVWVLPWRYELEVTPAGLPYPSALWVSIWPVLAGVLLVWLALLARRRLPHEPIRLRVAAGDLLVFVERVFSYARCRARKHPAVSPPDPVVSLGSRWYGIYAHADRRDTALLLETKLTRWETGAILLVVLIAALYAVLTLG
jgi:formate hydrogenlyase subunit 3/multisubunit Na+/H+ antiporter MnhD subunit